MMLKSEMQHHFWVTKKVVQRKLGSKEDECIVSSDAELDAKIELFKSISESFRHLHRIIDNYVERLCILAQEESSLGGFLREMGKNSNTTDKIMQSVGKSLSYSGQQRIAMRPSLLRLLHEVEVFRGRAIVDTQATIIAMEKERTEYRAALSWMKAASNQLDPDTGKGLEKFRKSQTHVRLAKAKFDRMSLDCLQKIDLLAAARCNMFSHVLVSYMAMLLQFVSKTSGTFKATARTLSTNPQYNFCILKELLEPPPNEIDDKSCSEGNVLLNSDQMIFSLDESVDKKENTNKNLTSNDKHGEIQESDECSSLVQISHNENNKNSIENFLNVNPNKLQVPQNKDGSKNQNDFTNTFDDLLSTDSNILPFMPSQLLLMKQSTDFNRENVGNCILNMDVPTKNKQEIFKNKNSILEFLNFTQINKNNLNDKITEKESTSTMKFGNKAEKKDISDWFHLFSELDPLSNPDAVGRTIIETKENNQSA